MGRIVGGGSVSGLGERIRERREFLGMSQGDLAERISAKRRKRQKGVNRVAISLFENDRRIPSAASLVELADVLQCSVDWLLGRISDPQGFTAGPEAAGSAQEATKQPKGSKDTPTVLLLPGGVSAETARKVIEATTTPRKRPAPAHEEGPTLEQMQAQAEKEGRNTVFWRGRLYMRKRHGWESVQ